MEINDINYWVAYDEKSKELHSHIDELVANHGWKSVVFAILKYQSLKINSNYRLIKSWL